jgi:hypothetical protein
MFQLSGLVTMDSTSPDGFLDTSSTRYKVIASNRLFDHATKGAAVSRCMTTTGEANIVGHGKPGIICTGSGEFLNSDPSKRISLGNLGSWQASGMTSLTLLGCNTGKGKAGADLLSAIAELTGVPVSAPTGYVYIGLGCDDYHLESGTGWQTAMPGEKTEERSDAQPDEFAPTELRMLVDARLVSVAMPRLTSMILYEPTLTDAPGREIRRWEGEQTLAPLYRVDFANPRRRGFPAAIRTGMLEVNASVGGVDVTRMFRVYNDNAVQDTMHPEVLYRANIAPLRG